MTTALRSYSVQDEYKRPVPGASIYVYNSDGSLASLTSDGTTVIANPLTTDAFGNYSYYALVGYYREDVWFGGIKRWSENGVMVGVSSLTTVSPNSILGNNTIASGPPLSLSGPQTTALLSAVVGDSGSGGTNGLVPAPGAGDAAAGKFLKANGTWAVPSGAALSDGTYGDITVSSSGTVMTIGAAKVSLAKMANLAANSILGNNTGSPATPIALTAAQTAAFLPAMVGDSGAGGTKGSVPAPASGDAAAGRFLKADGTWTAPPGSGAGTTTNALTFVAAAGDAATTTFNGSSARSIGYASVGAPKADGTNATGTWGISISGTAATATTATSATSAGQVTNAVTFNSSGGASPGTTFNGSAARTVDYSTLGAAKATPSGQTITSSATVTPTFSDDFVEITVQAAGLTLANPTGSAANMWGIAVRIKDNGTPQTIAYGTQYRGVGVALPTVTVATKTLILGMIFNSALTKWDVVSVAQE